MATRKAKTAKLPKYLTDAIGRVKDWSWGCGDLENWSNPRKGAILKENRESLATAEVMLYAAIMRFKGEK